MPSAHCPHIIRRWEHHPEHRPQVGMSSTHHLQAHMSSTHICRTPQGQHGPKLSFYCDRNWLLNGICHKNVELFHFRIM